MIDEQKIIEMYKSGLTMSQVSKELGFSIGKVHKYLSKIGINKSVKSVITEARNNKYPLIDCVVERYKKGESILDLHKQTKIPLSVIRGELVRNEVIRTHEEGLKIAASKGKLGGYNKGVEFSENAKKNISDARLKWSKKHAKHKRINSKGYIEFTTGDKVGRLEHTWIMEQKIGRKLMDDECVHHIDEDKLNNDINNLALMTKRGHSRHHRLQDIARNKLKKRGKDGAFCK